MTPYPLQRSETSTKILISVFLLFMVASFGIAFLNMYDKVGRLPRGAADRYGPDQMQREVMAPTSNTGGLYDAVPHSSAEVTSMLGARINTFSALLDLTHPHMFETPIVLLVLCHFLMRTSLANWAKITTYLLSFGSVAGILATPWLVRYVSLGFASLLTICASILACATLVLVGVPLWDMWLHNGVGKKVGIDKVQAHESNSPFADSNTGLAGASIVPRFHEIIESKVEPKSNVGNKYLSR